VCEWADGARWWADGTARRSLQQALVDLYHQSSGKGKQIGTFTGKPAPG
jgi:hypothetical protein